MPVGALAVVSAAAPSLLAYNLSPSPTYLNQALAFALWGLWALFSAPARPGRGPWALWTALVLLAGAALWSWGPGALPASLALSALGTLFAAAVLVAAGSGAGAGAPAGGVGREAPGAGDAAAQQAAAGLFAAFCWAWVAAGVLNIGVAVVQVFLPQWPDGHWLAASGLPGRAVGNLRQPNHLSSLLVWHCIAVVALLEGGRLRRAWAIGLMAAGVFAVVLTASRTGLLSVGLLAAWGLLDRRLARPTRALLMASPLLYLLSWGAMAQWAAATQHTFGGAARLAETDISSSRVAIWRDTLTLIAQQPWTGVGFGEFNLAWTLTPLPQRPVAFFDHTHNLPLQLAVELGLPLAALVLGLLLWALWQGARRAWAAPAALGVAPRAALVMVLMIGLHSLLEYPLWYSYFLLPAAWAWGFMLQAPAQAASATRVGTPGPAVSPDAAPAVPAGRRPPARLTQAAAALVVAGAALSVADYLKVVAIFAATPGAPPLQQRIAEGQRSIFFAHHADYAAVTAGLPLADPERAFDRVTHYLLDTRLMIAWAQALAARGEVDAARHLAARLREFRKPDAADFFAPCEASADALPYPCQAPDHPVPWRRFAPGGL